MSIPPNFNVRYELRSGHSGHPTVFSKLTRRKLSTRARDDTVVLDDGTGGRGHYKISELVRQLMDDGEIQEGDVDENQHDNDTLNNTVNQSDQTTEDETETTDAETDAGKGAEEEADAEYGRAGQPTRARGRNVVVSLAFVSVFVLWMTQTSGGAAFKEHMTALKVEAAEVVQVLARCVLEKCVQVVWGGPSA